MAEAKRFEYIIEFEPYYAENDRKERKVFEMVNEIYRKDFYRYE